VKDRQVGNPQVLVLAFPDDNNTSNEGAATFETVINTILPAALGTVDITD
jgi:hypothetical protein